MKLLPITLSAVAVSITALAGCVTTDANGKPIARDAKTRVDAYDAAMAAATLDGSRIVASGKPGAIAYLYPGTGRLSVRDLDSNTIPFSIDLTERDGPSVKTMIAISADGKLTGTTSNGNGPTVTDIANVNKAHSYVITFQPAAPVVGGKP